MEWNDVARYFLHISHKIKPPIERTDNATFRFSRVVFLNVAYYTTRIPVCFSTDISVNI